MKGSLSKLVGL